MNMVREDIIGISLRDLRMLVKSVREFSDSGVIHRGRGRPSNRRFPELFKARVLNLCWEKYRDFGPTLPAQGKSPVSEGGRGIET